MMLRFGKYTLPGTLLAFLQNRYTVSTQVYPFSTSTLDSPPPPQQYYSCNLSGPVFFSSIILYVFSGATPCAVLVYLTATLCRVLPKEGVALSTQLPFSITWLHQPVGQVYRWLLLCLLVVVSFFLSVLLDCFLLPQPEGLSPAKFQLLLHPNIRFFSKSHNFLRTRDAFLTPSSPASPSTLPKPNRNVGIFLCLPYVKQNILLASSPRILPLSSFADFDSKFYFLLHLARV